MPRVVQVVIDDSTDKTITGTYQFDRDNGGILIIPAGSLFPTTPVAGEMFWRTDTSTLYRRNDTNDTWEGIAGEGSSGSTVTVPIENGVTISDGNCVAASTTAGRVTNAVAGSNSNGRFIGVCTTGGTGDSGGTVEAIFAPIGANVTVTGQTYTSGNALYVPASAGPPTHTAPSTSGDLLQRIGYAHSATDFVITPGPSVIL